MARVERYMVGIHFKKYKVQNTQASTKHASKHTSERASEYAEKDHSISTNERTCEENVHDVHFLDEYVLKGADLLQTAGYVFRVEFLLTESLQDVCGEGDTKWRWSDVCQ